jgi:4-hydroxybenzoate polyprenyltransferase
MMRPATALKLARISNLPTVWSNVLAAAAITGAPLSPEVALVALAMSLFYTGGMFLNDAFDREIDARERPSRPIPAGEAAATHVFAIGFGALGAGAALIAAVSTAALPWALLLIIAIVFYDMFHKGNPVAPLVMGACRALVYVATAAALGASFDHGLALAAAALGAYVAGLTYAAKQEALNRLGSVWPLALLAAPFLRALPESADAIVLAALAAFAVAVALAIHWLMRRHPGDVGRAVSLLIAAIALCDALSAATAGAAWIALLCAAFFFLTLVLQRFVPGT